MCRACLFSCFLFFLVEEYFSNFLLVKEFYHKSDNKPKIFGMTASPVIRKGMVSGLSYIFGKYIIPCINIILSHARVILHIDEKEKILLKKRLNEKLSQIKA